MESRHTDETSAFTALFEEHGYLGARTNALDIVTVAVMGLDRQLPFIWPLHPDATAAEIGGSGVVVMDGAVQRGGLHARTVLCPVNDRLVSLAVSSVEEQISGETVAGSPWVRVQVWGCPSGDLGPWPEVRRRARLALASELVGVSRRIIDSAAVHIGSPRGPRREVLSEQTAPSGLTRASAKMADVRAVIAVLGGRLRRSRRTGGRGRHRRLRRGRTPGHDYLWRDRPGAAAPDAGCRTRFSVVLALTHRRRAGRR